MSTTLSGPKWSFEGQVPEERGQYPLGVEAAIAAHARDLVPIATTVTAHPRYYALHAKVAASLSTGAIDEVHTLLRRAEVVLAAATLLHERADQEGHDPGFMLSEPHGFRAVVAGLAEGHLDVAGLSTRY